jgi:hypothetical protein
MRAWCKNSKATRGASTLEGGDGGREGGGGSNPRKPREKATDDAEAYMPRDKEGIVEMCFF